MSHPLSRQRLSGSRCANGSTTGLCHDWCAKARALVPLATGGRYNGLLRHFAPGHQDTSGTGFGFNLERLRELLQGTRATLSHPSHVQVLITYDHPPKPGGHRSLPLSRSRPAPP